MKYGNPFRKIVFSCSIVALAMLPLCVNGQEADTPTEDKTVVGEIVTNDGQPAFETEEVTVVDGKVMLSEEGALSGTVFVLKDDEKQPVDAKISLSSDGVIVDSVKADENGVFSFDSVEPGSYDMFATADNMVASQAVEVMPYSDGCVGCGSGIEMGMAYEPMNYTDSYAAPSYDAMYDSYSSMPVDTFASSAAMPGCGGGCGVGTCGGGSPCGGGCGGGGRGGIFSRLPGAVGLVGLAGLAGLGGRDASPAR